MHTAKNMHQILDLALPAYDELFDEIKLDGLVENKGILYIWSDKDLNIDWVLEKKDIIVSQKDSKLKSLRELKALL